MLALILLWIVGTVRIGEALNLGPPIPWAWAQGRPVVRYPDPHKMGFSPVYTPGFGRARCEFSEQVSRSGNSRHQNLDKENFALRVESVNTNGWRALQRRIVSTEAHVILAQETWILPDAVAEASMWAANKGWKSLWAPAATGPGGGASGGTAIFVRDFLGLRFPQHGSHVWHPARACVGIVDVLGLRPFLAVAVYCHVGTGPCGDNITLLENVGAAMKAQGDGWQCFVGGDFNMPVADL